mmetsp:Transcript_25181/g.70579  ORF Transcript_25181/g.70579 Transcript_25181/m.70579 type:complete len:304 (+) Transcript_25181:98-1009(+)
MPTTACALTTKAGTSFQYKHETVPCFFLPASNTALSADEVGVLPNWNGEVVLLVPSERLLLLLVPSRFRQMIWHVTVKGLAERGWSHTHVRAKTRWIEVGRTGWEDTLVSFRRLGACRQLLLGLLDFGVITVEHSKLEGLNVRVREFGILVPSAGVALEVPRIVRIIVEIVLGDIDGRLGSWGHLAEGRLLSVVADGHLRAGIWYLLKVEGIVRLEVERCLEALVAFLAQPFLEVGVEPSLPWHHGLLGRGGGTRNLAGLLLAHSTRLGELGFGGGGGGSLLRFLRKGADLDDPVNCGGSNTS